MAGQIIPKGERIWLVRVFMGRDSQTGKRKYSNHTVHGSKKDAQTYLNGTLRAKDLGTFIEPSAMIINEYLNEWLETAAKPRLRERTYVEYEALLRRYVRPVLGGKKLADVRALDIQALYSGMLENKLSARTVQYTHAVLSSALNQAVKWGKIVQNPAAMAELPRQSRMEMKALSPEDAAKFLEAAVESRYGMLFGFALATGMRPSEYLGLQWRNVDLEKGIITVQRTLVWRTKGNEYYFSEPKTLRSNRSIPLPRSVIFSLNKHKRKQAEERLKVGPDYVNLDLVFSTSEGMPLKPRNITEAFKVVLKHTGLPSSFRLYDLRHTCATLLLVAGENPKIVSERLGHSSITLTMDVYSHVLPNMQEAASAKLENILFSKVGTL